MRLPRGQRGRRRAAGRGGRLTVDAAGSWPRSDPTHGVNACPRIMRPERFRAKWIPVRAKKTRQNKNPEPRSDSIGTEKALDHDEFRLRRRTTSPSPRKRGEPNVHVDST